MVMPALKIPVSANLDAFKKNMDETSAFAKTAARKAAQHFLDMNKQVANGAATAAFSGMAASALKLAGRVALVVGSVKLMGDAVGAARDQLKEMVDIADKATSANFSSEFWQSWVNGAKGAEKQVEILEGALNNAFQALKPVLNPDWSVWDTGLTKVTAVESAMRDMRELFSTDQDFSGLTLFKNASNQDQQTTAVLTFMKQLQNIGQDVAALDLGDKLFGSRFTDQIRNGTISVDRLLDDIKTKSADAFSNETVKRAKDLDQELRNAWHTVSQNLHPSLESLDSLFLDFKSAWVEIVKLIGRAAELSNKIRPASAGGPNDPVKAIDYDEQTRLQNRLNDPGLTSTQRKGYEDQLRAVQSRMAQAEASKVPEAPINFNFGGSASGIPLPLRRPDDAPKPPAATSGGIDPLDRSTDQVEKRAAALQAEAGAYDLGTAAREKARIEAQLLVVAVRANTAAGKADTAATAEQRKTIEEVAQAYADAALAVEKAKIASQIKFGQQTSLLDPQDVAIAQQLKGIYPDVAMALNSVEAQAMRSNEALRGISGTMSSTLTTGLTDILDGTKSVGDGFWDMSKMIIRALEEAMIKMLVVAPIMRGLQMIMGGGFAFANGGAVGGAGGLYADGGIISGPGGPRSDSILARVSPGEFITNAASTSKYRPLLEAINNNSLPRFADGGAVGSYPGGESGAAECVRFPA